MVMDTKIVQVKEALHSSEALLIGAGAGMGVDSGLPDFRGKEGFWKAYPPLANLGIRFEEMANPKWFQDDPDLAWGFYGHRLHQYRNTNPHAGFSIIKKWMIPPKASFVYTSNVDGHFQKAGFEDRGILECHGSIHFLQCMRNCGRDVWSFPEDYKLSIDQNLHAREPLPSCPDCNGMARPNILMFSDYGWDSSRVEKQMDAFSSWVESNKSKSLVIVEMGAGLAVPTVRLTCEGILHAWENEVTFVRINPREVDPTHGVVNMRMGALAALKLLDQ